MDLSKLSPDEIMTLAKQAKAAGEAELADFFTQQARSAPPATSASPASPASPSDERTWGQYAYENLVGEGAADTPGEKLGMMVRKGIEGLTAGLVGDEADAMLQEAMGGDYGTALAEARAREAAFAEEHPYLSMGSEVAGGVLGSVLLPASRAVSVGGRLLGGAIGGAVGGGTYGFMEGEGEDDRMRDLGRGAIGGAVLGAAAVPVQHIAESGLRALSGLGQRAMGADGVLVDLGRRIQRDLPPTSDDLLADLPDYAVEASKFSTRGADTLRDAAAGRIDDTSRAMDGELDGMFGPGSGKSLEELKLELERAGDRAAAPFRQRSAGTKLPQNLSQELRDRALPEDINAARDIARQRGQTLDLDTVGGLDAVTQRARERARAAGRDGMDAEQAAAENFAQNLRSAAKTVDPEYGRALELSASGRKAADAADASTLLRKESLVDRIQSMDPQELSALKTATRDSIYRKISAVMSANMDDGALRALEMRVRELSSETAIRNIRALTGRDATPLLTLMKRAGVLARLRREISATSAVTKEMRDNDAFLTSVAKDPIGVVGRVMKPSPAALAKAQAQAFGALADTLANVRGPDAGRAMMMIRRAQALGRIEESAARFIGKVFRGLSVQGGPIVEQGTAGRY